MKKEKKLLRSKALLKESWDIYKKNFTKLFFISAIFIGLMSLATMLIGPGVAEHNEQIILMRQAKPLLTISAPQYFLLLLVLFLFSILGHASLVCAIKKIPKPWSAKEAIGQGSRIFWSFLWISILSGIIIGLGFVVFIIPGVIFMVWFAFSGYVLVFEGLRGWSALKRSKELVKEYWWPTFGRLIILALVGIGASMLASWIPYVGSLTIQILLPPFSTAYGVLIFKNLKEIKNTDVADITKNYI